MAPKNKKSATAEAAPDTTTPPPEAAPLMLSVKVLTGGLRIAKGVAAAGKVLTVSQAVAEYHEGRGEVRILGTVG